MPATASSRRVRRSLAEWSALVAEQAASGESQQRFCTSRGLAVSSFCAAKQRLRSMPVTEVVRPQADFVPVQVSQSAVRVDADVDEQLGWDIELTLGSGVVLRVRQH